MAAHQLTPRELLQAAGRQLQAEFQEIRDSNPHAGDSGAEAEEILKNFLRDRLPRRFGVESGIVIGTEGAISRQTDLIVYDALNSPVYRKGPRTHIVPRDNVAAVIEVKSKLSKEQLTDAADKIASVKRMKASPINNMDEHVTMSSLINSATFGCVFAYDAYTSLETLAENLREINETRHSREWIDFVIVLGRGTVGYAVQMPFQSRFQWFGGQTSHDTPGMPVYVHEILDQDHELALNRFFLRLMSHLAFFRRRTSLDFDGILGTESRKVMTLQGYQFKLDGSIVQVENSHVGATFENPKVRFWLYDRKSKGFMGQVCRLPWQDGAVITYSGHLHPQVIYHHFFKRLQVAKGIFMQTGDVASMWMSSVLPFSEDAFISAARVAADLFMALRSIDDEQPSPTYPGKPPPKR